MIDKYKGYTVSSENIYDIYLASAICLNCGRIWSGDHVVEMPLSHHGFSFFDEDLGKFIRSDMGMRMTCPECEDHKWRLEPWYDGTVSRRNEDGQYEVMDDDEIFRRLNLE